MKTNSKVPRRKFLKLGSAAALAGTVGPQLQAASWIKNQMVFYDNSEKVRLFSNENPYGPSAEVLQVIAQQSKRVNRYASYHPFATDQLAEAIAQKNNLTSSQVLLGHGSFEILCMLSRAFGGSPGSILAPELTFNVIAAYANKIFENATTYVPVNSEADIDLQATINAITPATKLIYLCNPNNPTGKLLPADLVEDFCKEVASGDRVIAIDEAYIDLVPPQRRPDLMKLLQEKCNILSIRTFSKAYGMAGLRIGYLMGLPETIQKIKDHHIGFYGLLNNHGTAAAITALANDNYVENYRLKNQEVRDWVIGELQKSGLRVLESNTNFIMHEVGDVKRFKEVIKNAGLGILPGGWPKYPDWVRVSIATRSEMEAYMAEIKKWVE